MLKLMTIIDSCADTITQNTEILTSLDQAIGDGDHGINLKRGFDAIKEQKSELIELPLGKALQSAGMKLVMSVGGASGPLYGSLLMAMGKSMPDNPNTAEISKAFEAGVEAVKARGKSDVGQKTMLDVLIPLSEYFSANVNNVDICANMIDQAQLLLESTREMQAKKGRASFLGERSIGHLDPGAYSSALLVKAICELEKK